MHISYLLLSTCCTCFDLPRYAWYFAGIGLRSIALAGAALRVSVEGGALAKGRWSSACRTFFGDEEKAGECSE